ncbi:hypothetical protein KCU81_g2669, partial [Aureobasidium melanogenum]|uniref:Ubiquitin-like protease family profile domain-containing protein n=1 Tax=Aureobasidium melanogenum (strain CBS 110374) TaxID=1043003 RepID=A0A074WKM9_AURM1
MSKRKLESQSPPNMSPHKKTRVVPGPKLHRWTGEGFEHMVYTPPVSPLPSPFGIDFHVDQNTRDAVARFGPALQVAYEAASMVADKAGARQTLLNLCNNEQVAWIDPLQPITLKSGEGLSLSQENDETRIIRLRKVFSAYASRWFAFVQRDTHLTVNGQNYPNTHDIIIGPLPPFSVVEYHDRVVFLYLNRESVDYRPGKLDSQPSISRILASFKDDKKSASKGGTPVAAAASSRGEIVDIKTSAKTEPEVQPKDSDSSEYFKWRMREWKLLKDRSNVALIDPAKPPDVFGRAEWLVDSVVYRAIASVTTAIGLENDIDFAMIDEWGYRLIKRAQGPENESLATAGRNRDLFLPYNTNDTHGLHWLLVHAKYVNSNPEIHVYDTLSMARGQEEKIKRAVLNTRLYDVSEDLDEDLIDLTHHIVARQPSGWECGYLTILNAWCLALGMKPGVARHYATSVNRILELIDMINYSMAGFMDSATIQAYMHCVGFVDADHNTIASDRHFTRSVPFLTKESLNTYILMRQELEKNPHSAIRRLDLATVRFLLRPQLGDFEDLDTMKPEVLFQHFDRWLKDRDLIQWDPKSPLSPTSPATMRLAFGIAESTRTEGAPLPTIPDDTKLLRKIWNIYHRMLKQQGYLGVARQERAKDMADGSFSTQEISNDAKYPYDDPKVVALDRLGMLPTEHFLTPYEKENIRGSSRPAPKLRLRHK